MSASPKALPSIWLSMIFSKAIISIFKGIQKQIRELLTRYDHLSFLINDPCQNPTGYSLSAKEWAAVVDFFGEEGIRGHVDLIIDAAYIDFAPASYRSG
jgi:aspartate/tyrosine/aromatic aminotransferase